MQSTFIDIFTEPSFLIKDSKIVYVNNALKTTFKTDTLSETELIFNTTKIINSYSENNTDGKYIYFNSAKYKLSITKLIKEYDFLIVIKKTIQNEANDFQKNIFHTGYIIIDIDDNNKISNYEVSYNIFEKYGIKTNKDTLLNLFPLHIKNNLTEKINSIIGKQNEKFEYNFSFNISEEKKTQIFIRGFYTEFFGKKNVICSTLEYSDFTNLSSTANNFKTGFYDLFSENTDTIIIINNNKILSYNKAAEQSFRNYNLQIEQGTEVDALIKNKSDKFNPSKYVPLKRFQTTITLSNDIKLYVEFSVVPLKFIGKHTYAFIIKDLTKIKELIEKTRNNEKKYNKILNGVFDGIILINKKGIIEFWNKKAKEMFGYSQDEIIGKPIYYLFQNKNMQKYFEDPNNPFNTTGTTIHKNKAFTIKAIDKWGNILDTEFNITSFKFKDSWKAIGVIRNVTKKIQIQNELTRKKEELTEINNTFKNLFSIIGHDLRTPLFNVIGFSNLTLEKTELTNNPEIKRNTELVLKSGQSALNLLEDLLLWGRSVSNNIVFNPVKLNIDTYILKIIERNKPTAVKKGIKLKYEPLNLTGISDINIFETIINNLITNAIKFSLEKSKIEISCKKNGENIEICVTDEGIGMTKEELNNLFKLDKVQKSPGTANEEGTGLGLILANELIRKNNGKIWVESTKNIGSKFHFTIPTSKQNILKNN